ncbi:hypothetical protein RZS08_40505, partial [Arthrospira platensis SPKY1]|nr:hypothetical protein [Arthrospira platensis SPKY1]
RESGRAAGQALIGASGTVLPLALTGGGLFVRVLLSAARSALMPGRMQEIQHLEINQVARDRGVVLTTGTTGPGRGLDLHRYIGQRCFERRQLGQFVQIDIQSEIGRGRWHVLRLRGCAQA